MPAPTDATIAARALPGSRRARLSDAITRHRPSLFTNTMTSMVWYVLVLIQGFILPRLISDHLGQDILGIWDLGWTLVFYTNLLSLGTRGAVARYVARYRAQNNTQSLNEIVNSSLLILSTCCVLGLIAAGVFAYFVPALVRTGDAALIREARWVIFLLSASAALQLPGGVFNAVITGCERFDMLNIARGARDIGVLIAAALLLGAGQPLRLLALLVLAAEIGGDISKYVVARRLIPDLRVSARFCRWSTAREMVWFGGKTVIRNLSRGGTYQFNSLMVSAFLGPSVLAVFARQRAPLSHAMKFMNQYAQVFIPKSSALDADGDVRSLQRLLILSTKFGFYLTMPMIAVLLVMGTPLMTVWMGRDYVSPVALTIFTMGHALLVPQQSAYSILMGIDRHGRVSWYEIGGLILSVVLGYVMMGPMQMGMVGAAIAVSAPLALSNGILMPIHACRMLKLSPMRYWRESLPGPLLASIPCVGALVAARMMFSDSMGLSLAAGMGFAAVVMLPIYWFFVTPAALRERIVLRVSSLMPRRGLQEE